MAAIKGVTRSGFDFTIDQDLLDDMELIELLAEAMGENPFVFPKVIEKLLGKEQKQALYAFLKEKDGRVSVKTVGEAVADMFAAAGEPGKN